MDFTEARATLKGLAEGPAGKEDFTDSDHIRMAMVDLVFDALKVTPGKSDGHLRPHGADGVWTRRAVADSISAVLEKRDDRRVTPDFPPPAAG
jgi:hypothetical protein